MSKPKGGYTPEQKARRNEHSREYGRDWRAANKEKKAACNHKWNAANRGKLAGYARRARLKHRYDLTQEQFDALLSSQGFRCAICETDEPGAGRRWNVDHCHSAGTVRGLLCHRCNVGLGYFLDNKQALRSAVAYLEKAL